MEKLQYFAPMTEIIEVNETACILVSSPDASTDSTLDVTFGQENW